MLYLVDSHCHLHDREFFTPEQAEDMIKRAHKAEVKKIICIGTSHEDSLVARDFALAHENIYWTYGIHPSETNKSPTLEPTRPPVFTGDSFCRRRLDDGEHVLESDDLSVSNSKPPVAIGEVGLDYHYEGYDREAQIRLFEKMLQLATDNDLPVSFHVREAFPDFFAVVKNFPRIRGVVHSFTDSKKVLKRVLSETEFYVGVNGLATYSTLPLPPLERILLETDAPFLAPIPHRGETNEPAYIPDIAKWLSGKFNTSNKEVAKITTENAEKLFNLTF